LNERTTASSSNEIWKELGRRSTVVDTTMDGLSWLRKQVEQADTDLLREMVRVFAERLMAEEADAICGAPYGERSDERVNRRNGYRARPWDTRTGTIDLAVPKLREGSYFPDWLLEPRRRAERAFVQVVCESYTRRVDAARRGPGANARGRADLEEPRLADGQGAR
jgi:putative transposase